MLAWKQSVRACLFLHPGSLWVGGVVVCQLQSCVKLVKNGAPPHSVYLRLGTRWMAYGVTMTSQSQHTVAAVPKCLLAKTLKKKRKSSHPIKMKWFFLFLISRFTLTTNILGNAANHMMLEAGSQSANQLQLYLRWSSTLLLVGRAFYTPNRGRYMNM